MTAPKVVLIGGGHGLPIAIEAALSYASQVTAIATVADDGGSSGILRESLHVLPPGDSRNCLVAMAPESLMRELFQFRFQDDGWLKGHALGNFVIAALQCRSGSFGSALEQAGELLGARGRVMPPTDSHVTLCAKLSQGATLKGQCNIANRLFPAVDIWLEPADAPAYAPAVEAIREADQIVLGPGSLYTSIMPNLLVEGIREAVRSAPAQKVFVCNRVVQPGETDGMDALDHLEVFRRQLGDDIVDDVLIDSTACADDVIAALHEGRSALVGLSPERRSQWPASVGLSFAEVGRSGQPSRHDAGKLAGPLSAMLKTGARER